MRAIDADNVVRAMTTGMERWKTDLIKQVVKRHIDLLNDEPELPTMQSDHICDYCSKEKCGFICDGMFFEGKRMIEVIE